MSKAAGSLREVVCKRCSNGSAKLRHTFVLSLLLKLICTMRSLYMTYNEPPPTQWCTAGRDNPAGGSRDLCLIRLLSCAGEHYVQSM
jgi:hypothetical protein